MNQPDDIPVLDDLIEKGIEITLSDLGLDDEKPLRVDDVLRAEMEIDTDDAAPLANEPPAFDPELTAPAGDRQAAAAAAAQSYAADLMAAARTKPDPLADNPALEQAIRRILDEHMELAWQEIRLAIREYLEQGDR